MSKIDLTNKDPIMNICETLLEKGFNADHFVIKYIDNTCVISSMNRWTTALIKIKIKKDKLKSEFKNQSGIIQRMDLEQKIYKINPTIHKDEDVSLLSENEKILFDSHNYKGYTFEHFMNKLNCKYKEKNTVLIADNRDFYGVFDVDFLKSLFIGTPELVFIKLFFEDGPLCLNYSVGDLEVYCLVAPKLVAHNQCNIVKVY